jgi:hypothetical protein
VITPAQRAGRTEEQWDQLVATATEELISRGGSAEPTIHYSDLNNVVAAQTGQPTFDLSTDQGRWALGAVLGEVNDRTYPVIGALLSALVWHKGSDDLGHGFYDYAQRRGMLRQRATRDEKLIFLAQQVRALLAYCGRTSR